MVTICSVSSSYRKGSQEKGVKEGTYGHKTLDMKHQTVLVTFFFALWMFSLEQEAEDDGESSGSEDEGPQTDHQRHGEAG